MFVDNLTDFLIRVVDAPEAANETFLVSDGRDLSTSELVSEMRLALCRPYRLWPCPWRLLRPLALIAGEVRFWRDCWIRFKWTLVKLDVFWDGCLHFR